MVKVLTDTYSTFKTIFTGMGVTWRHLFKRSVTVQYPDERDVLPERVRLKLDVNIDDCIGCRLCERACPVDCITIGTTKSTEDDDLGETSTGHKKKLWVDQFDIDLAKCCYCELCVHPCPTECITMVEDYEYSVYDRENLVYSFSDMTPGQIEEVQAKLEREEEEKRKKKEEARLAKKKKEEEKKAAEGDDSGSAEAKKGDDAGGDGGTAEAKKGADTGGDGGTAEAKKGDDTGGDGGTAEAKKGDDAGGDGGTAEAKKGAGAAGGDVDPDKEARRKEREARRAARKAEREAKKKSDE